MRLSFLVLNQSTREQKARSNISLLLRAITHTCAAKEIARERVSKNRFKRKDAKFGGEYRRTRPLLLLRVFALRVRDTTNSSVLLRR